MLDNKRKKMKKKNQEHFTIKSICQWHPDAKIIEEDGEKMVVQLDKDGMDFYVVPKEPQQDEYSFKQNAFQFLKFMYAVGSVCKGLNDSVKGILRDEDGEYESVLHNISPIKGYAVRISFTPKTPVSNLSSDILWNMRYKMINEHRSMTYA